MVFVAIARVTDQTLAPNFWSTNMIIVTGGSGQLGRKVVDNLLHLVPAERIGVSVRIPDRLAAVAARGVRVRHGDFEDAESLRHAWEGAERLLLISSNAAATGGDMLKQHATAIEVARDLGVDRIFYTSQVSSSENSCFPPGRNHAATERMLAQSGLAWTSLRHGFYADSALSMNATAFEKGVLAAPADGKVAWTTHDDLAAADAAFLTGKIVIDGPTPPLTGGEALDLADLADLAGEIMGRTIRRTVLPDEDMKNSFLMGYYLAARAGEFASVDPTLTEILGRAPETMRSYMTANLR